MPDMNISSTKTARIEAIDVLRGFTLSGIILVHMAEQYYAGMHPASQASFGIKGIADEITSGFTFIFILGKFYMIFSFLFGLSFYLQLSRHHGGAGFLVRFAWRLVILFAIGFLHHLHYRGDILTIYAVLGIVLILFYRLPDKWLLAIALIFTLNLPSVMIRSVRAIVPYSRPSPGPSLQDDAAAQRYFDTVKSGSYAAILRANLHEFKSKYDFQVASGRVFITMGLFLLGVYAGRKKIFEDLPAYTPFFKRMIRLSCWSALGSFLFLIVVSAALQGLPVSPVRDVVSGEAYDIFNAALAAFYGAGILLLFGKEKWHTWLLNLYPVGRMGLTTYLMQTVFGFLIFFSVGFDLLGEIGATTCFGLGIALFLIQIQFSKWWFRHFRYGFFEWIWRCLTDFRIYSIRSQKSAIV
jgi:uncharacterized protein